MRTIDADELMKKMGIESLTYNNANIRHGFYKCMVLVADSPVVEPQRTGRWLPDNNSLYEMRFICSECKESQVVPTIGFTKYKPIWDFCPNCGADMREPEDIPMEYFESGGR